MTTLLVLLALLGQACGGNSTATPLAPETGSGSQATPARPTKAADPWATDSTTLEREPPKPPMPSPTPVPTPGSRPQAVPRPAGSGPAALEQPFRLGVGESATLEAEKLVIRFVKVQGDTRCPSDVQCVQAGEAFALLEVQQAGGPVNSLIVSTMPTRPKGIFGEYWMQLQNVEPGPAKLGETIPPEAYVITLLVTRLDSAAPSRLERPFQLRGGETATLEGGKLKVRFAEVEEDSRCPKSVVCEWGGEARIRLEVQTGEAAPVAVTLSTLPMKSMGETEEYRFELYAVAPYPETPEQEIAFEDYIATLAVTAK